MSASFRFARKAPSYLAKVNLPEQAEHPCAPKLTQIGDFRNTVSPMEKSSTAPALETSVAPISSIIEERYPDIAKAITLLWGFPEMNEYFDRMWLADGGARPIDPEAMSELMLLSRVHSAITPGRPTRSLASILGSDKLHDHSSQRQDVWSDVPRRR